MQQKESEKYPENGSEAQVTGEVQEEISDEDVVYQINTFGADFTIDGLVKRFDRGDIFIPNFQRSFVWTWPQASKFIESILLGLPIPSIFLYREESSQKHLIVDGLQRLTTLSAFNKGRLPNDRVFRLKDVKSKYEGKTLEDLDDADRRRFDDAVIHAMIIQQLAPNDNNTSVYHIFDRLNSNGTPLQPQEIRAAVYHGDFQELLGVLNQNKYWREIFGPEHKRAKDQELILRFLALTFSDTRYYKPMKAFLNDFMRKNRKPGAEMINDLSNSFSNTIELIHHAVGRRAFRPARSFNVAAFDAIMVGVYRSGQNNLDIIKSGHDKLLSQDEFLNLITGSTSDEAVLEHRLELATAEFGNVG